MLQFVLQLCCSCVAVQVHATQQDTFHWHESFWQLCPTKVATVVLGSHHPHLAKKHGIHELNDPNSRPLKPWPKHLSLYLTLFPEWNRLYILGFLESLSSLFSPLAGEGYTCLDHSKLSKKKKTSFACSYNHVWWPVLEQLDCKACLFPPFCGCQKESARRLHHLRACTVHRV